jgi:sialidase-1
MKAYFIGLVGLAVTLHSNAALSDNDQPHFRPPASLAFASTNGPAITTARPETEMLQVNAFAAGQQGYHTFRIPSLIVTPKGAVLAFCEGRKHRSGDSGSIDLVLKRSSDLGQTWSDLRVIWHDEANTCGDPCPIVDRQTGAIWLLLSHNLGTDDESRILAQTSTGTRTVWVSRSDDDGVKHIGCLYERGNAGPYEAITFARFTLEWLTGARN